MWKLKIGVILISLLSPFNMTTIRDIILHPTFTWSCVTKIIIDSFITAISDSVGAIVEYGNKDIED